MSPRKGSAGAEASRIAATGIPGAVYTHVRMVSIRDRTFIREILPQTFTWLPGTSESLVEAWPLSVCPVYRTAPLRKPA
jgi:hypothetical protein